MLFWRLWFLRFSFKHLSFLTVVVVKFVGLTLVVLIILCWLTLFWLFFVQTFVVLTLQFWCLSFLRFFTLNFVFQRLLIGRLSFWLLSFWRLTFWRSVICCYASDPEDLASNPEDLASDLKDMVVDSVQKQLEVARLKSNRSTTTASTLINTSPRSSAGSGSGTGTTSGTASGSGVAQTSTILSTQIQKLKNAATAPRILGGGTIIRTTNYGSLITDDGTNNRCRLAHLRELYDQKLNVSTSFDPSSLSCSNCSSGPHQIIPLSGKGHSFPACFILSHQNFPPALPTVGAARRSSGWKTPP